MTAVTSQIIPRDRTLSCAGRFISFIIIAFASSP